MTSINNNVSKSLVLTGFIFFLIITLSCSGEDDSKNVTSTSDIHLNNTDTGTNSDFELTDLGERSIREGQESSSGNGIANPSEESEPPVYENQGYRVNWTEGYHELSHFQSKQTAAPIDFSGLDIITQTNASSYEREMVALKQILFDGAEPENIENKLFILDPLWEVFLREILAEIQMDLATSEPRRYFIPEDSHRQRIWRMKTDKNQFNKFVVILAEKNSGQWYIQDVQLLEGTESVQDGRNFGFEPRYQ